MQLTCIHPTALEQERKLSGLWVYTDSDPSIYRRIKQTFQGVADPFISPEHFQQQVIDLRPTVLNWVDKNLLQIDKGNWYQAAVYKNPYSCEFFSSRLLDFDDTKRSYEYKPGLDRCVGIDGHDGHSQTLLPITRNEIQVCCQRAL
ncbi:MAG: hypothetical protein JKX97_05315 [Candidatus Lindowbacteria bacterium]|nr:hypothetical protein [Candidatus Lindowbacteria bacterium]